VAIQVERHVRTDEECDLIHQDYKGKSARNAQILSPKRLFTPQAISIQSGNAVEFVIFCRGATRLTDCSPSMSDLLTSSDLR
jgi:hypothetical protein